MRLLGVFALDVKQHRHDDSEEAEEKHDGVGVRKRHVRSFYTWERQGKLFFPSFNEEHKKFKFRTKKSQKQKIS